MQNKPDYVSGCLGLNKASTSIQMDGALPPDFSKSETDSDIITKLFSVIYVQKFDKVWGVKLKN